MKKIVAIMITVLSVMSVASVAAATNVPEKSEVVNYWENGLWELPEKGANW